MTEKNEKELKEKILQFYGDFFDGNLHIAVLDDFPSDGRSYETWHDEIVEQINEIRIADGISAAKAGKRIADPYLKEHNITFKGFMSAYWKRKRERSEEQFMRAISAKDIDAAVEVFKHLSKRSKEKLVPS